MEEQRESGFLSRRYFDEVCRHCIGDPTLAIFVAGHGRIDECKFCGRTEVMGTQVGVLFHYMAECLGTEWDDPNNEVGWDHGFHDFVGIVDSYDLLWRFDDPLENEELQGEFVSAFEHQWCPRDPYRLEPSQMLLHSWKRFVETVKTDKRYLLHLGQPEPPDESDELLNPADVLGAIGAAIIEAGSQVIRSTDSVRIVRARAHSPSKSPQSAKKLGSPPSRKAQHNRMSGAGISMFYGAETATTAMAEIRCDPGHVTTVGAWTPSRALTYLDLPATGTIPSIFDTEARDQRIPLRFLASFAEDLAKPIDENESTTEYIPTQIVTEYLRDHFRTPDDRPIDGIRYSSARDSNSVCWVVFAGQEACTDDNGAVSHGERVRMILNSKSVRRHEH